MKLTNCSTGSQQGIELCDKFATMFTTRLRHVYDSLCDKRIAYMWIVTNRKDKRRKGKIQLDEKELRTQ